ncbi:ATP-dependent DNA helicase RecQ [Sediminibacterium sp. KACHI17]|uniref:ATP-dependent DNA helicase RecQ n=2 Tax=Sediminibacterium sp. KACHI17 TaxID=1751071 RepID=A0AAT9GIX1_9BACT
MQEEIIQSVLDGKDTLALLPTGGGKSICFQVPALLMDGLCLVISPLIALMQDQVAHLIEKGIAAATLNSGMSYGEVRSLLQKASRGDYKFLYVSPERIESALFKEYLPVLDINLIAVDEAHCISQWGYDFRPPYLRIAALREELSNVTIIALTASATEKVQEDIIQKLALNHTSVFRQSFERPALSYSSFEAESKMNKLIQILQGVPGSSIVYTNSRKLTKEVCQLLQLQGILADYYHAGLTQDERERKQKAWIQDQTRVMVCTNAFGMGIDKPNVRSVIHYNIPDCLENYYQEAGRAGRDGKKSFAVLLYHLNDIEQLKNLPDKKFPPLTTIQSVYQSLADFFQLPVGTGEGAYFDFDLRQFTENFKLDTTTVINTLKVLEQEGHISFAESIFLPSQVMFVTDKDALYAFETAQPQLEGLIKILLRTYEGIFDNRVSIFESSLAKVMRTEQAVIQQQLKELAAYGIIEYLPKKDSPQIHYLLNRAPAKYLHIDHDAYHERKQNYTARVSDMIRYVTDQDSCRSKYIGNYFGDTQLSACGICDHCLAKKKKELSPEDFSVIENNIRIKLTGTTLSIETLLAQLSTFSKEKIWTVLDFMQTENALMIGEDGKVSLL